MSNITDKVLKLLEEEGIQQSQYSNVLMNVVDEMNQKLWEIVYISQQSLCSIKDIIWFNLEHLPSGGNRQGVDDLRFLGSKYPTLIYHALEQDIYLSKEQTKSLLLELEDISNKWSNDWSFVQLFTKSQTGWNGGDENPSSVIIYDPNTESPTKYGYKYSKNQLSIVNPRGEFIQSEELAIVLCSIETKLGTYDRETLLRGQLYNLIDNCRKAVSREKGIMFQVEQYNYNNY